MSDVVSIITPLYNSSEFLEQTIQSVVSQTYQSWEMIMVDDCSTDNSLEIAQRYAAKDKRIKVLQLKQNSGAAVARNAAIEAATGRFIAFLDSDDLWVPEKLIKQVNFMVSNDIDFSYCSYEKIDRYGNMIAVVNSPNKVNYKQLLKTCVIGCLTAVYDTKRLGKIYMPTTNRREDFATWLYILKNIDYAYGIDLPLARYRVYDGQSSGRKFAMAKENWRLYREMEKLNFFIASYYFMHYAVNGVLRTKLPKLANLLGKI